VRPDQVEGGRGGLRDGSERQRGDHAEVASAGPALGPEQVLGMTASTRNRWDFIAFLEQL
jgi:hypothetical protein